MSKQLKNIRLEKRFTQIEVANSCGISERTYQYIEAGTRIPNVLIAIKIAKMLNASVEELFK